MSHRTKFSSRAVKAVFVGYPVGYKGYKLYDLENKRFFISKDVKFIEDEFPFHNPVQGSTDVDEFPTVALPTPLPDSPFPALPPYSP